MRPTRTSAPVPGGVLLLVLLVGGMTSFGIATAIGARTDADESGFRDEGGPATKRQKVGEGSTPANGRYELYRAADAEGRQCFGIKLFNQPTVTGEALFEGCGNASEMSIASLTFKGETIIYGRVPPGAEKVRIAAEGHADRHVAAKDTSADLPGRFIVSIYSANLKKAKAEANDKSGKTLKSQEIPLPIVADHP